MENTSDYEANGQRADRRLSRDTGQARCAHRSRDNRPLTKTYEAERSYTFPGNLINIPGLSCLETRLPAGWLGYFTSLRPESSPRQNILLNGVDWQMLAVRTACQSSSAWYLKESFTLAR
jgi:hypothetical protein